MRENNEFLLVAEREIKKLRRLYRFKQKIRALLISDTELNYMRRTIIKELKPIFAKLAMARGNDYLDQLAIQYFEERINTLPKDIILDLFEDLQLLKQLKTNKAREYMLLKLIAYINLLYSLHGWFLKKIMQHL